MKNAVITMHNLDFEVAPWDDEFTAFRIGTCDGLYGYNKDSEGNNLSIDILAIQNREQGNGHFEDVMEWFEYAAKRDNLPLRFLEIMNPRFFIHLVKKRGFMPQLFDDTVNVIKYYSVDNHNEIPHSCIDKIAEVIAMATPFSIDKGTSDGQNEDKSPYWAEEAAEKLFW